MQSYLKISLVIPSAATDYLFMVRTTFIIDTLVCYNVLAKYASIGNNTTGVLCSILRGDMISNIQHCYRKSLCLLCHSYTPTMYYFNIAVIYTLSFMRLKLYEMNSSWNSWKLIIILWTKEDACINYIYASWC